MSERGQLSITNGHLLWTKSRFRISEMEDSTAPAHKEVLERHSVMLPARLLSMSHDGALVVSVCTLYRHTRI